MINKELAEAYRVYLGLKYEKGQCDYLIDKLTGEQRDDIFDRLYNLLLDSVEKDSVFMERVGNQVVQRMDRKAKNEQ